MLKCACRFPFAASSTPLFLPAKNCTEQLVLIISSVARTVRNTFILVTHSNIYTFTHIFAHALSLGCIYVYCLGLATAFNQYFRVSSYELSTKPSQIWVLGSWIQPPLETKLVGFGKPAHPSGQPIFYGTLTSPGDPPLGAPLSIIVLKETIYFENTWVVLITLSRSCLEWEQRHNDLWASRFSESGKISPN